MISTPHLALAGRLAALFSQFPQVEAVAVSGSLASGAFIDPASDIDLYVFIIAPIPLEARVDLVEAAGGASRADMNLDYWDIGDEWFHAPTGIEIDVMYWDTRWVEDTLDRVLVHHQPSLGYTTAHWQTIHSAGVLFDRSGWLGRLKQRCEQPYPEDLRRAVIRRNHAILRGVIPAYLRQVEKAAGRGDLVSANHRVAAFFASYFDLIFAANGVLHPGEKRLLEQARRLCPSLPPRMPEDISAVLQSAGEPGTAVVERLAQLCDRLDRWLGEKEPWLWRD
jgi:predicted nucleotidyltransferase